MSDHLDHYGGVPVGPAIATVSPPTLTEGRPVRLSVDLDGNLRTVSSGDANVTIVGPLGSQPAAGSVSVALASDQLPLPVTGTVSTAPVYSHTISAGGLQTVTTDSLLLAQNLNRVGYTIQNISLKVIYVLEGTGTCSATDFTYALPACGLVLDGSSPVYRDTQWQGPVRICSSSGTGQVSYAEKT